MGRGYYKPGDAAGGHRNGYWRGKLDSAEGRIDYAVPQVRGTAEPFRSVIHEARVSRTEALERLAIEMYARGLSVRHRGGVHRCQRQEPAVQERGGLYIRVSVERVPLVCAFT